MKVPIKPKIYHIVHMNNLVSILRDDYLWSEKNANETAIRQHWNAQDQGKAT